MSKDLGLKVFLGLSFVAVAVLWLLSVVMPEQLGEINLASWGILIVSGCWGLAFILSGLFGKMLGGTKKLSILIGAGLLVVSLFMIVNIFAIDDKIVLPIVAIIVTSAFVLCTLAVGGKKWDHGDNHKVGYKNYHQRKAEEVKNSKEED